MIKYDDIISTLTLVNILAKDVDYGNIKQENLVCKMEQSTSKVYCVISKFYSRVRHFYNRAIIKIGNSSFAKFKGVCETAFFTLEKDLIIFLQRFVLYCKHSKLEYG